MSAGQAQRETLTTLDWIASPGRAIHDPDHRRACPACGAPADEPCTPGCEAHGQTPALGPRRPT